MVENGPLKRPVKRPMKCNPSEKTRPNTGDVYDTSGQVKKATGSAIKRRKVFLMLPNILEWPESW